jgi:hypothetical protein
LLVVALSAADSANAQTAAPIAAPVPATAAAPVARDADAAKSQGRRGKSMNAKVENADPAMPDAALLEYLGEYGDAADGLDPMGLADPQAPVSKSGDGKNGQGH